MSKVVAVTGAFQKLHHGHINILREARKLGEIVVLLNSDRALIQTKGYLAEFFEERKENVYKTGLVKLVLKIEESPRAMLKMIRPDYQVCGSDHDYDSIMQNGGCFAKEIIIVPRTPGISSTDLYKETLK